MSTTDDHGDAHEEDAAHDDDHHEHNLELAPAAPRPALVRKCHSPDVYNSTAFIIPGAAVVLHHPYPVDPAAATLLHKTKAGTKVPVREVELVPGISVGYITLADYIFVSRLPVIEEQY